MPELNLDRRHNAAATSAVAGAIIELAKLSDLHPGDLIFAMGVVRDVVVRLSDNDPAISAFVRESIADLEGQKAQMEADIDRAIAEAAA